jgi:DUF438 domain-containing protein
MVDLMNEPVVKAMFETVPIELTVIDANDKVIGWNKHHTRLFFRPDACMGMDFRQCHPQKSLAMVERIVAEMKAGTRDKASFWIDLEVDKQTHARHKILIEFYALRDINNVYLGCMECTQDVEEIRNLQGEKRLMNESFPA